MGKIDHIRALLNERNLIFALAGQPNLVTHQVKKEAQHIYRTFYAVTNCTKWYILLNRLKEHLRLSRP